MWPNPAAHVARPSAAALGNAAAGGERRPWNRKQHPVSLLDGEDDGDRQRRIRLFQLIARL